MPTIRNDKREAKNRRQKVVAGRTRQRERRWNGDEIEGWGERERDSLLGEEKIRASSRRSQVGAGREKSIPRGAESGGAVWRGGATPFFGVHGGENDNWSSWQRPSHLVSILPRPLRLPTNPSNPQTSPRDLSCLPHPPSLSFSLVVRFLSFFGRGPNEWRSRNRVLFLLKIFRRAATCHPRSLH